MAVIKKRFLDITGTLQNITMYTRQDSDKVIVRMKGGPSRKLIDKSPNFEKLRNNNNEWKGCTMLARDIRSVMGEMKRLEDYPVTGFLNALAKKIQACDVESEHGQRNLYLSRHKELIGGFSLSRKQVLESVLRVPVDSFIDREKAEAKVSIPSIDTKLYLYNYRSLPYFRIVIALGAVSDILCGKESHYYQEDLWLENQQTSTESDWLPTYGTVPAQDYTLALNLSPNYIIETTTLILCIGIEFGKMEINGQVTPVKYTGCGKIVKVG
jgi:hypothetical protein